MSKSKNICMIEAEKYIITGASWDSGYGPTYEIGVRAKNDPKDFVLIQPEKASEYTINMLSEMTKVLLDHGFTPTEIQRAL